MKNDEIKELESTTIWDFPERGHWSSHNNKYRGNYSPKVVHNILMKYSKKGDLILDPFLGGGTTCIEALLLERNFFGTDVSSNAIKTTISSLEKIKEKDYKKNIYECDARNLKFLNDKSVDLICTHPPYFDVIKYDTTDKRNLSNYSGEKFNSMMKDCIKEFYRVLKDDCILAITIGDTRKNGNIVPLGFKIYQEMLNIGFKSKEIIIKKQHNCKDTNKWKKIALKNNFLLLEHEYIFIMKK